MARHEEWDWPPPRRHRPAPVEIDVVPRQVSTRLAHQPLPRRKSLSPVGKRVANGVYAGAMLGLKITVAVPLAGLVIGSVYVLALLFNL